MKKKVNLLRLGLILSNLATVYNLRDVEVYIDNCSIEVYYQGVIVAKITLYDKILCNTLNV